MSSKVDLDWDRVSEMVAQAELELADGDGSRDAEARLVRALFGPTRSDLLAAAIELSEVQRASLPAWLTESPREPDER